MEKIKVSIISFAYNHEKFIGEAIESFVSQKTNFAFEVIIHDDASKDSTASIISYYEKKYPDTIKPIYQKVNQASQEKGRVTKICLKAAKGEYIAICEGDDYWTDPLKLQKQVDLLTRNPKMAFVHTDYDYLNEESKICIRDFHKKNSQNKNEKYSFTEIFEHTHIRTLTTLYRTENLLECSDIIKFSNSQGWVGGDLQIFLYLASHYEVGYIPTSTGVYRRLNESASSFVNNKKRLLFLISHFEIRLYILNCSKKDVFQFMKVLRPLLKLILIISFQERDTSIFKKYYNFLSSNKKKISLEERLFNISISNISYTFFLFFYRMKEKIKRTAVTLIKTNN